MPLLQIHVSKEVDQNKLEERGEECGKDGLVGRRGGGRYQGSFLSITCAPQLSAVLEGAHVERSVRGD